VYYSQDKLDDIRIGLYSPALFFREYTILICTTTALGFLGLLTYGAVLNGQGLVCYFSVAVAGTMLLRNLLRTDIDSPTQCKAMFLATPLIGQTILVGFVVDAVVHRIADGVSL
jgi:4-hydroxybenzoate polyprenyltransferase